MAEKLSGALKTIGEASSELNIRTHILRYWEEHFPMLQPLKRAGGRRYYRPEDMALLRRIDDLLNRQGFTAKGAVTHLKRNGLPSSSPILDAPSISSSHHAPLPRETVRELQAIHDALASALAR